MTWAKRLNRVFKIDIDGIFPATLQARRHDWLTLTGGAIGVDIPFPIIADLDMKVAKKYGMIHPGPSSTANHQDGLLHR